VFSAQDLQSLVRTRWRGFPAVVAGGSPQTLDYAKLHRAQRHFPRRAWKRCRLSPGRPASFNRQPGLLQGWGQPVYTMGEAVRACGKSKPAIAKAIRTGRISATRADDGSYRIDPAELHRVYPVAGQLFDPGKRGDTPADSPVDTGLLVELTKWRALAEERDAVIRDLRSRLDRETEERRRLIAVLTGPHRPWWRGWFR
jgi:hypothetical protein